MSEASLTAGMAQPQSLSVGTPRQFGYSFFRPDAGGFAPLTDVPVGPDYVIGAGDRIVLTLWGSIEGNYELEVNRTGEITLPRVGTVKIAGVNYGQLPQILRVNLAKVFKDFQLNVNLGKLRLIKVFLVGEVRNPGDYNLSSLSTLINALSAAGGPTYNGTLRNIQIKRNGKLVETVDLYDFFLKGDKSRDIRLQPGDTVFVPTVGPVAGIAGNVRKPAIYELRDEKSLKDLLALADGINPSGYLQRIQISRVEAHEKRLVNDFSLDPKSGDKTLDDLTGSIAVRDMDFVKIFPIDGRLRGYVRLDGYVLRPGDYALKPGMRISDLVGKDNLLQEHFSDAAMLTRLYPPDFHPEKIFFNLGKAMAGDGVQDMTLQEFDVVRVFSRYDMEEKPIVSISGEVQHPGVFRLTENETVSDLVKEAGNLKRLAFTKKAEIRRIRVENEQIKPYSIYINLEEALKGDPKHNIVLAPFDEVVVKKYDFDETRFVRISGEIQRPGEYRLVEKMTIADLAMEAGGLKKTAFTQNAEITRLKISGDSVSSFPINVNLEEALKGNPKENILLERQDTVTIRRIPNWAEETERYVTLKGEFRFPGVYPIFKGENLSRVIERAGGFTDKAYLRAARFSRESIRELQQKRMDETLAKTEEEILKKQTELSSVAASKEELEANRAALEGLQRTVALLKTKKAEGRLVIRLDTLDKFKGSSYDVEVMGGDTLEVPKMPNAVNIIGQVYNPTSIIPVEKEDVAYYLDKVGGPTREAEEDDIYIVRVDGTVQSRQQTSIFKSFMSTTLGPGDTIIVPQQFEKTAWMRDIKDIATILGQLALTAGVMVAAGL
jgi:protein involved in polysaccharide export with SLBB domain